MQVMVGCLVEQGDSHGGREFERAVGGFVGFAGLESGSIVTNGDAAGRGLGRAVDKGHGAVATRSADDVGFAAGALHRLQGSKLSGRRGVKAGLDVNPGKAGVALGVAIKAGVQQLRQR